MSKSYCLLVVMSLLAACTITSPGSRRPLSACARGLVESGYISESNTAIADNYCNTHTREELEAARVAVDRAEAESLEAALRPNRAVTETAHASVPSQRMDASRVNQGPPKQMTASQASPTTGPTPTAAPSVDSDKLDALSIAETDTNLSRFVELLNAAGMAEQVRAAKTVTLLAPTNAAFEKLPHLASNKNRLRKVLAMHVIMGEVSCADAPRAPEQPKRVKTLAGKRVPLRVTKAGVVSIGRAKVLLADLVASNGGIDIIDTVLAP